MTKTEFIVNVAQKTGVSKKIVEDVYKAIFDEIAESMKNKDKIQISGFGTFEVAERAARTGRNPATGAEIEIPATTMPKFKPAKGLKDSLN